MESVFLGEIVQHAVDSVSDAVFVCDEGTLEFIYVNQGAVDLHGYSREELLAGMTPVDLAPSVPEELLAGALAKMAENPQETVRLETTGLASTGEELPVEVMINWPLPIAPGGARPVIAIVRDIRARVEAEQRFRAAFGDGPVPMTLTEVSPTVDRVIVEANQAMADLLGYRLDELTGMSIVAFSHPDDLEADNRATSVQREDAKAVFRDRKRYVRKDGSIVWVQLSVSVLSKHEDRILTIGHSIDITAEVEAERHRARNQATVEALSEIRSSLLGNTPIEEVLAMVCVRARDLIGADWVAIWRPDPDYEVNALVAVDSPRTAGVIPREIKIEDSLTAVLRGETWSPTETTSACAPDAANRQIAAPIAGPMIMVPIFTGEHVDGILGAGCEPGGKPFAEEDIELISGFASSAASAIRLDEARAGQQRAELLEDRERIGRDMHDIVIGNLFATGMTLQSVFARVTDPAVSERLGSAVNAIDEAIKQIRTTVYGLRSQADWGKGARGEVLALAAEHNSVLGYEPKVFLEGPIDDVAPEVLQEALATLREALTNSAKYSKATSISVHLKADRSRLSMTICDDGVGFEPDRVLEAHGSLSGNGMTNIRARARSLGGLAKISSAPGDGTKIEWTVPGASFSDAARNTSPG